LTFAEDRAHLRLGLWIELAFQQGTIAMPFHPQQAWNLAFELYDDKKMAAQENGFINDRFKEGISQDWIRPARRREALEMFVFDEVPLLPPDLDTDSRPIKDHVFWVGHVAPNLNLRPMGRFVLPEVRALKGLILANLQVGGVVISPSHLYFKASFDLTAAEIPAPYR
jgi:hypothetical protein